MLSCYVVKRFPLAVCLVTLAFASTAVANVSRNLSKRIDKNEIPAELKNVGIKDRLGEQVSINELYFNDENGERVTLSKYFNKGVPVVFLPVYYECPNLCTLTLNGFLRGLKDLKWTPGEKFQVIAYSIDSEEGPDLAKQKKAAYLESYGRPEAAAGWHFLSGEESQIQKLSQELGFGFKYLEDEGEYAHSAGAFVLTPEGKISRTLHGIQFLQQDLRLALLEASSGKIGNVLDRIVMFCFRYDSSLKGYSLEAMRVVQAGGAGTVLLMAGYFFTFWRRQRRQSKRARADESEKGELR